MTSTDPEKLQKMSTLITTETSFTKGNSGTFHSLINTESLRLAAWFVSNNKWKQREHLKTLQNLSQMQEELLYSGNEKEV